VPQETSAFTGEKTMETFSGGFFYYFFTFLLWRRGVPSGLSFFSRKKVSQEDGLVWNKWEHGKFPPIPSLDKSQGLELKATV
jgi:hypothetical protein